MTLVVVAIARPRPDAREAILAAAAEVAPVYHEEPGCELWALHEDGERIVVIEKWADRAALDAHNATPTFRRFMAEVSGSLAAPLELMVLTPHLAGGPRGAL